MGRPRFNSIHATPSGGIYEYAIDGDVVRSKSRSNIGVMANDLRKKHGLPTSHDPFIFVMEYMCPRMPNGFCTQPSSIKTIKAAEVKEKSARLFNAPCATSDVIDARLAKCIGCPMHRTRGFCMDCTGMIDWMLRGYGGKRPLLPVDHYTGVCECDLILASVLASAAETPLTEGAKYPEGCWRTAKEV